MGLNEYKLERGFKEMFGTTVFAYLTEQRLDLAKRYLLGTKKNASEIVAFELGMQPTDEGARAPEENPADIPELAPSPALDKLAGRVISSMEGADGRITLDATGPAQNRAGGRATHRRAGSSGAARELTDISRHARVSERPPVPAFGDSSFEGGVAGLA